LLGRCSRYRAAQRSDDNRFMCRPKPRGIPEIGLHRPAPLRFIARPRKQGHTIMRSRIESSSSGSRLSGRSSCASAPRHRNSSCDWSEARDHRPRCAGAIAPVELPDLKSVRDRAYFASAVHHCIAAGKLPPVSFYKPAGRDTQQPSYTDIMSGDLHIAGVLDRLRASPQWKDMLVIVTYDENGGYWDHVPPPTGPGWGERWGRARGYRL